MNLRESVLAILAAGFLYVLKPVVALACDWVRARWSHHDAIDETKREADLATNRQHYAERRLVYHQFRRNINVLLDAMDGGVYQMSLLYEVRDQWGEIRRSAPADVVAAATAAIDVLKPLIDHGPTDERFIQITRALHRFEDACRADAGLDPAPRTEVEPERRSRRTAERSGPQPQRQYFSVVLPDSEILDQSDDEAALSRLFVEDGSPGVGSSPRELMPRR